MTVDETLAKLLKSYRRYYNIETEDVPEPFAAMAAFHTHDEQFFLVKAATLAEADAHEYVFFVTAKHIGPDDMRRRGRSGIRLPPRRWRCGKLCPSALFWPSPAAPAYAAPLAAAARAAPAAKRPPRRRPAPARAAAPPVPSRFPSS